MVNPIRGEISVLLDGKPWTLCLTLGALASLEESLGAENLFDLSQKFASGNLSSSELLKIIHAGLLGGGHEISQSEVGQMRVEGSISGYVEIAAKLLSATFTPVGSNQGLEK